MAEKKTRKKTEKKSDKEIENKIEAEKILFEKVEKAEQIEEKKEEEAKPSEKVIQGESRILRNLLLIIGLIVVVIGFILILNNTSKSFTVDGVKYTTLQQGQLTLYNTWIPVLYNGSIKQYNFYLYSDPRVIQKNVPFNASLDIATGMTMVLNMTGDLNCNGDGIIAVANLATLYNIIGKTTKNSNTTCDPAGRYAFINIQAGNETSIQQIGPACYNINVYNCQILAGTERYMTQTFAAIHNISA